MNYPFPCGFVEKAAKSVADGSRFATAVIIVAPGPHRPPLRLPVNEKGERHATNRNKFLDKLICRSYKTTDI